MNINKIKYQLTEGAIWLLVQFFALFFWAELFFSALNISALLHPLEDSIIRVFMGLLASPLGCLGGILMFFIYALCIHLINLFLILFHFKTHITIYKEYLEPFLFLSAFLQYKFFLRNKYKNKLIYKFLFIYIYIGFFLLLILFFKYI